QLDIVDKSIFDCNDLEGLLRENSKHNYFDMTENEEFDFETIPRRAIIRFEGEFNILQEFDMMDLINDFKTMLTTQMGLENNEEEEIFNKVFGKDSTKIPVFFECDNLGSRVGFSKVNSNDLKYQLTELEDFEDE